jgi:N-acetylglutamate synthase-like GNAT family acetyltransferase
LNAYCLRPAQKTDAPAIRKLIWQAHINPMQINWQRFIVAVDEHDRVTGCAQVKTHRDGTHELASLVVDPQQRGSGIARVLIEYWLARAPRPLYLTCRSSLQPLYEKFGFRVQSPAEMTPYFYRLHRLVRAFTFLGRRSEGMLVMVLE